MNFDQCEYGLHADGSGLNKKATTAASNKPPMRRLHRPCSGNHTHARLLGGTRSRSAENYRDEIASMAAPEGFERLDDVFPVSDDWDMTSPNRETDGPEAIAEAPTRDATVQDDEVWTGETDSWKGWRR